MAHPPAETLEEKAEGLTRNCLDSLHHALAHFSANAQDDYGFHNQKWAILSVAHAAEAFCNLLLLALVEGHPNSHKYPDLEKSINALKANRSQALSGAERHLITKVLPGLEKQRNQLMHRLPPATLDAEQSALVLLALLYLVRRRVAGADDLFLDDTGPAVFDELRLSGKGGDFEKGGQARWFALAEILAFEDYGTRHLEHCEYCERFTKTTDRGCIACLRT